MRRRSACAWTWLLPKLRKCSALRTTNKIILLPPTIPPKIHAFTQVQLRSLKIIHEAIEMSLSIPQASQAGLFKQGYNSYDAEDGAVIRNIDACRTIAQTVQTSLGPYGRNKIVINHLAKMILTSDAATILRELDVVHPAAKLLVMASQQQEAEMGDATNMVIILAGELLKKAEELVRLGLKTSDITAGYEKALTFTLQALEGMNFLLYPDKRS